MQTGKSVSIRKTEEVFESLVSAGSGGEIWQRNIHGAFRQNRASGEVLSPPANGKVEVAIVGLPKFYGKGYMIPCDAVF